MSFASSSVQAQTGTGAGPATPSPSQRIVLVTGSTDGLGREVASRLAAQGAHVIVHGRNVERGRAVVDQVTAGGKGSARFYQADFSSLADVRRLAADIRRDYGRLDLLINNAGIITQERRVSADGVEMQFAVNYLAGVQLTYALLPLLENGRSPRIINVSSISASPIDFADVMLERDYSPSRAYGQSKLAQVMFTIDLAEELKGRGIVVHALHPAGYMDTTMVRSAGGTPRTTVAEGAEAVLHVVATGAPSGRYFVGKEIGTPHPQAADAEARRQLRALSRRLIGM
ncbi:MAG: SDR family NAD(P)-dependent oxidoreductase [Acidobacteria bacterium]|nr:SDR family NAD(P)-dependent oxidoreductase [Acidobacteriota bacterium]